MNGYGEFAVLYDKLTGDVNYEARCDYIEKIFARQKLTPKLICDLACGTGSVCLEMNKRGYDLIGVDVSLNMLSQAIAKSENTNILYLHQDITEFELYGTVDVFLCLLDSVNHLTEDGDVDKLFALVKNYLNPNGIFIFDVNTKYKFENILSDNIYTFEDEDVFYVWENNYENGICDMYVDFFVKNGEDYKRIKQDHSERYYSKKELSSLAKKHGFKIEGIYAELTFDKPKKDCQREFWVLKKE